MSPSSSPLLNLSSSLLDLALKLSNLLESLLLLFLVLLLLGGGAANSLPLQLLGSSLGNIAGSVITKELLQGDLDKPASTVVDDHDGGHVGFELVRERNKLHTLVDVGEKLESTGKSQSGDTDDTVEHTLVLGERLTEGTALIVDGEGRDLLDKLEKVDGRVEQRWSKFSLEINILRATIKC